MAKDEKKFLDTRFGTALLDGASAFFGVFLLWPLFDLFWANVIDKTEYSYDVWYYLRESIIFGVILMIISALLWRKDRGGFFSGKKKK